MARGEMLLCNHPLNTNTVTNWHFDSVHLRQHLGMHGSRTCARVARLLHAVALEPTGSTSSTPSSSSCSDHSRLSSRNPVIPGVASARLRTQTHHSPQRAQSELRSGGHSQPRFPIAFDYHPALIITPCTVYVFTQQQRLPKGTFGVRFIRFNQQARAPRRGPLRLPPPHPAF